MKTSESSPEILIAPNRNLKLVLHSGNITLHLKKVDGIEMTYPLDNPRAYFNEDVSDYVTYQVIVNTASDYEVNLT